MKGVDVDLFSSSEHGLTKRKIDHAAKLIFEVISKNLEKLGGGNLRLEDPKVEKYVRAIRVGRPAYAKEIYLPTHCDLHSAWVTVPKQSIAAILSKKIRAT